jgi:protein involved in polysaccharide export with SLBB domain
MRNPLFFIFITLVLLMQGCAWKTVKHSDPIFDNLRGGNAKYYLLGAGDVIKITLYEKWPYSSENYSEEMTVREDGSILLPPIGKVVIENTTVNAAEEKIVKLLDVFLKKPFCQITVKEYNSRKVCILGDLRQARTLGIQRNDRVLDILTRAEGRSDRTYLGPIRLIRKVKGETNVYDIDLKRIIKEGVLDENVLVADGDIIFVPKHPIDEAQRLQSFLNMLTFWVPTYFVTRTLVNDIGK